MSPQAPGAHLPDHPDFLWRNPEPKRSYDVVDHRRRRAWPGDRPLPREEPRHHERRCAREGLARRRQHGPQHDPDPVELPMGREFADLRTRAEAVGGPRGRPRLPDPVQPARRAEPRAQSAGRPRQRAPGGGQRAQRRRRRVAGPRTRSRSSARSSTSRPTSATRCSGRPISRARESPSTTTSLGVSPAAPMRPAWISCRAARSPGSSPTATV